jgi:predicted  nucleic acid-binding Zn-ribbon protein
MYLEEILRKAFSMNPEDPPADLPSNTNKAKEKEEIDPLVELELEELNQHIERYEKEIAMFESYKNATVRIPKWLTKAEIQSAYQKREAEIKNKKQSLTEEWYSLKENFEKLRKKMPKAKAVEISKKLASMKRKLNAL